MFAVFTYMFTNPRQTAPLLKECYFSFTISTENLHSNIITFTICKMLVDATQRGLSVETLSRQSRCNVFFGAQTFYLLFQHFLVFSESEYFTGDTSIDIHSPGPTIAKTSLYRFHK